MKSSRDSLLRSRFTRRTATVTMSAPLASSARAVSWKDLYFPVPSIRRDRKERPAIMSGSVMTLHCKPREANIELRSTDSRGRLSPHDFWLVLWGRCGFGLGVEVVVLAAEVVTGDAAGE